MKNLYSIGAPALLLVVILLLLPFPSAAAVMSDYCMAPPLIAPVSPNVLLSIDVSGSMGWEAYSRGDSDSDSDGILDNYDPNTEYEGYFDPEKTYELHTDGIYREKAAVIPCVKTTCNEYRCFRNDQGGCVKGTGTDNTRNSSSNPIYCRDNRWRCCDSWIYSGDCNVETGNYLNYEKMARIDIIRWVMTGGRPYSCTSLYDGDANYCDPEMYNLSGNNASSRVGTVCTDTLDVNGDGAADGGCILWLDNGDRVRVRWDRVKAGLAFQFQTLPVIPRLGAGFFDNSQYRNTKVYLGDFTSSAATKVDAYPYANLISQINSQDPGGSTPTGPAMVDAYNYFAQNTRQYNGWLKSDGTSTTRWLNPMYDCKSGGTTCTFVPCAGNYVMLLSDGSWNQPSCSIDTAGSDPVKPAYQMHMGFLNSVSSVTTEVRKVYTVGLFLGGTGQLSLQNTAMYGSFDKTTKTWPGNLTGFPANTCTMDDCGSGKGSGCTALPPASTDWDDDANTPASDGYRVPDTFFQGSTASQIKNNLRDAMLDILGQTTAGTAASVLASREGSGASLLQAVYYPKKTFDNRTVDWVGNLQNLWYYIDPAFSNSTIREDGRDGTVHDNILNLKTGVTAQNDYITKFSYDSNAQSAIATRWTDTNGDASIIGETQLTAIKVDAVANIWEAGHLLWLRDWKTRKIFTSDVAGANPSTNLIDFKCTASGTCPNNTVLRPYLNLTTDAQAAALMEWVLGNDVAGTRQRAAQINGVTNIWKLGDVISSTPKISSWQPLGDYHLTYRDYETTYGPIGSNVVQSDPVNTSYYTTGYRYKGRGMAYAGGNDGVLHAFRLGLLQSKWSGQGEFEKAKLTNNVCSVTKSIFCSSDSQCPNAETCSSTVTLGDEAWAFIPKNVLPYLKYLADPNYCHLYTVDLTPTIFDASIGVPTGCSEPNYYDCAKQVSSWRTVLIGGMRLGGACRKPTTDCSSAGTKCVSTPLADPVTPSKGLGYSSYFALDITDQDNPKLMWEYDGTLQGSYSGILGFSYSGPAVVRISNTQSGTLSTTQAAQNNGRWLVVFGSGPTGPIDTAKQQFIGLSDRDLTLHIFDLATGPGAGNTNVKIIDTNIANSFSGSITTTTFDIDLDYSDDVIYIPYTTASTTASSNGGLLRLVTKGDINPNNWEWSHVITNAGPITAAPDMLIDPATDDLWLYFGTGRYFYDTVNSLDDGDPAVGRQIFGMKERCLNAAKTGYRSQIDCNNVAAIFSCGTPSTQSTCGGLTRVDNITVADTLDTTASGYNGWYIDLDPAIPAASPLFYGERMITNPSVDATGIVFFTTFKPQNNACQKDGQTNIWSVKFDTGGAATGLIKGTAIIQVSTGSIEQVNLATAFTEKDGRRTAGMTGQPPTREGLTVIPGAPGVSKPLFMKER